MTVLDNPERAHIGKALDAHRIALGIHEAEIRQFAPEFDAAELAWLYSTLEPSILRIRRFHYALMEVYERLPTPTAVPVPFREQWFTTRHDQLLHSNVLMSGRRTAWWWGARRTERGTGAYCYVCDTLIHPYDLGRGVTHPVRFAVMQHRAGHVARLIGVTETRNGRART